MFAVRIIIVLAIIFFFLGCPSNGLECGPQTVEQNGQCIPIQPDPEPDPDPDPDPKLPLGLHRILGIDENLPYEDLEPLEDILDGALFVGLGETVHTSEGYYQAKVRLIKYMVEKLGFRAVTFESPWPAAEITRAYAEKCEGSMEHAIRGLFGVWQSVSVGKLLDWLCEYNTKNPSDRVHFAGFDVQQPWDDYPPLAAFLEKALPDDFDSLLSPLDICIGFHYETSLEFYQSDFGKRMYAYQAQEEVLATEACGTALQAIEQVFEEQSETLIARTSEEEMAWAEIHLIGLISWHQLNFYFFGHYDFSAGFQARDKGMSEAFQRIRQLRFPHAKAAIWAHNSHIAKAQHEIDGEYYRGARAMGTFLYEEHGSLYRAIGLLARDVKINWPGMNAPLPITAADNVETILSQFEEPFLLYNLHEGDLLDPEESYGISDEKMVPVQQFDALFYLDHSPPMQYVMRK